MMNVTAKVTELKHNCCDFKISLEGGESRKIYECDDEYDALHAFMELFIAFDYDYQLKHEYSNGGLTTWVFNVQIDDGDDE